jgi:eukaryotic-like serine/threonine-protein kinase
MSQADEREEALFEAALKLTDDERAAYLNQACADDADLQRRVEALIRAFGRAGGFLNEPASPERTAKRLSPPSEKAGDWIGRYKLLEKIGEGGCGVVYVAEQQEPVRRRVALKVIKLGMDTRQVIARFEAERQALAMMDHPNIAKIHDAGATETGRPFFVMELVRGIKITEFCDESKLSTEERLNLFVQVCHAIQHAHQKGVIHRDIKPSNILVTRHDGVPVPKVIDFGIAKATQGRLTDQTVYTAFEQFIGTPAYMSPEQAQLSMQDIDTRSDIYSLGVLLYELLTGTTPFDAKELLAKGLDEMCRTIREVEPLKPSTRLTQTAKSNTRNPQFDTRSETKPGIDRDLDWIVMKCLEKSRGRRYETVNGLATDIQRHLNDEPITARPPSKLYGFRKTVRRHKVGFAAAAGIVIALGIGLCVSTWQYMQKNRAYQRAKTAEQEQIRLRQQAEADERTAEIEAIRSAQVARFLQDMLKGVGPSVALGRDTKLLKEILDQTAERVSKDLTNQPEVEAELRSTIGDVYQTIREHKKAEAMHRDALAIRRKLWGNENAAVAASLDGVGRALWKERRSADAESILQEALAIRRKTLGNSHPDVASSLNNLGRVFFIEGKPFESERCYLEALAILQSKADADRTKVAATLGLLAEARLALGKLKEAEDDVRESLKIFEDQRGSTNASALGGLGRVLAAKGRLPEAETAFRDALDSQRKILGNESPELGYTLCRLADVVASTGKLEEAESLYKETVRLWVGVAAEGDLEVQSQLPVLAQGMSRLASQFQAQGKSDQAEELRREATRMWQTLADTKNPLTQDSLGYAYATGNGVDKDLVQAAAWFRKAAEQGNAHAQSWLGYLHERGEGVETDFVTAVEWYRKGATNGDASAQRSLGRMYFTGTGVAKDETEAAKWYLKAAEKGDAFAQFNLAQMYALGVGVEKNESEGAKWFQKAAADGNPEALNGLAWLLATSFHEGIRDGTNAVAFAERAVAATSRTNANYLDTLAAAYAETGDFEKAISIQKEAIAQVPLQTDKSRFESRLQFFEARTPYRE